MSGRGYGQPPCKARRKGADRVSGTYTLDQIDQIAPPGTDVDTTNQEYTPPALQSARLRRRPVSERSAA